MAFDTDFLERLRDHLPVSEVVGRRVRLTRRGREHSGLCPFHNEKTPSFTVNDDKQFYHCFGCGAHGDVIRFVMETEGLEFREAIEKLAPLAGLEVPRTRPEDQVREKRRAGIQDVLEEACRWFAAQLASAEGGDARAYLQGRGLEPATLERFRLGFAPNRRGALRQALNARGMDDSLLIAAGLLKQPEEGGAARDYFFDRIIFPITDRRGRVIAFGGRAMAPDAKAKYLNSPDTELFHKGQVLYNLHQARQAARDGADLIVAEGYMDVIAMAQAGFPAAVAPLGTALTEAQLSELWRMAPEPVICLDGDEAGQRAARRVSERALPLLKPGHSLRFVTLPPGEDPDSLVQSGGAAALKALLDQAKPLAELLWSFQLAGRKLDTPERRAALRHDALNQVDAIQDPAVRSAYRRDVFERLDALFAPQRNGHAARAGNRPRGQWQKGRGSHWGPPVARSRPLPSPQAALRRRPAQVLLALALAYPQAALARAEELAMADLGAADLDGLRRALLDLLAEPVDLDSSQIQCHLREQGFSGLLEGLSEASVVLHEPFLTEEVSSVEVQRRMEYWLKRTGEAVRGAQESEEIRRRAQHSLAEDDGASGNGVEGKTEGQFERMRAEISAAEDSTAHPRIINRFEKKDSDD
ncbi:DNA primase [Fodinicurvata sediminis]|uniref:DNA primase n=1 Tax=Fodinicurvata sediminis TaxID=1121832 RepID=UPI0003B47579|nr:DNA primase [Fodinicurvata sediminis]